MSYRTRTAGLLAIAGLAAALIAPATALADGPGNNGLDPTGNGTKSNATVGGVLSAAGSSATMSADAVMYCSAGSVGNITGSFTLSKTLDVGSTITIYMVPNNGSNANPPANVTKNEGTITLNAGNHTSGSVINWSLDVTSPFTATSGGILVVFAVNADGVTAISSSKTNSLNCTEGSTTSTTSTTTTTTTTTTPTTTTTSTTTTTTPTTTTTTNSTSTTTTTTPTTTSSSSTTTTFQTETTQTTSTTQSTETTLTPQGSVEAETGSPTVTPPSTDAIGAASRTSSGAWNLVLALGAVLSLSILVLTPMAKSRRRK